MNPEMTNHEFRILAQKYHDGEANEEERFRFEEAYFALLKRHPLWDTELMGSKDDVEDEIYQSLESQINSYQKKKHVHVLKRYIAAAAVLLLVGIGAYFVMQRTDNFHNNQQVAIVPGSNSATLTLADGSKVNLSDADNGTLLNQSGIQISKSADGQLHYKVLEDPKAKEQPLAYNTVETPRGGQYQIILPDGTQVWLNAASSLRFPSSFAAQKDRRVELQGEAYFEVAKDKSHPFKVINEAQEVEVLGTHFNINSYKEEKNIKTTLLEGSVRVSAVTDGVISSTVIIRPGQQSILTKTGIQVVEKDLEQAIDWKNGDFIFQHESLEEIMNKIARWYNVQVEYDPNVDLKLTFSGQMSRSKNIAEILENLERTEEIKFQIKGTTVRVKSN